MHTPARRSSDRGRAETLTAGGVYILFLKVGITMVIPILGLLVRSERRRLLALYNGSVGSPPVTRNDLAPAPLRVSREQAAANALASVRVEGLDPGIAEPLLDRWAREEITDAQLDEGIRRIVAREPLTDLLRPAGT